MKADNLYRYVGGYDLDENTDEDLYALVIDDSDYRGTDGTWEPGVVYLGIDGRIRSTTKARWEDRFEPVAEYAGDNEDVKAMILRTNRERYDMADAMTAWHESDVQVTSELIRLAAVAMALSGRFPDDQLPETVLNWDGHGQATKLESIQFTLEPRHLSYVSNTFRIEEEADGRGYKFTIRK